MLIFHCVLANIFRQSFFSIFVFIFYLFFLSYLYFYFEIFNKDRITVIECVGFLPHMINFCVPMWVGFFKKSMGGISGIPYKRLDLSFGISNIIEWSAHLFGLMVPLLMTLATNITFGLLGDIDLPALLSGYLGVLLYTGYVFSFSVLMFSLLGNQWLALMTTIIFMLLGNVGSLIFLEIFSKFGFTFAAFVVRVFSPFFHVEPLLYGIVNGVNISFLISLTGLFFIIINLVEGRKVKDYSETI